MAQGRGCALLSLVGCVALLAAACATPVGAVRVEPDVVHRTLTGSVLSVGTPSIPTQNVLHEQNLAERFDEEPEAALADLHAAVVSGRRGVSALFALSELSFFHAERTHKRAYYLAAAVYAYAFLFPDDESTDPDPFDPRLRLAADLYNRGITGALASENRAYVDLRSGVFALPFGELHVSFDRDDLIWHGRELTKFVPVAELDVFGLRARYRRSGIGAPLAASAIVRDPEEAARDFVARRLQVPVMAVLRIQGGGESLAGPQIRASLELYVSTETELVTIGTRRVPLEVEPTAALAYQLGQSPISAKSSRGGHSATTPAARSCIRRCSSARPSVTRSRNSIPPASTPGSNEWS